MFKKSFLLFSLFLTFTIVQGQQCSNLLLEDIPMICTGDEVTITGSFLNSEFKSTSAYAINGPLPCPIPEYDDTQDLGIVLDDAWSQPINLGFNFCFFENQYDKIQVADNGIVSFRTDYVPFQLLSLDYQIDDTFILPTQNMYTNAIFAPFIDTYSTADGGTAGEAMSFGIINSDSENLIFAIEYDTPLFSCNELRLKSRVMLYENSNVIDIVIFEKPVCTNWQGGRAVLGIQNKSGTIGYSPFNRGVLDENNTPPTLGHTWIPGDADSPNFDPEFGELFRFVPDGDSTTGYTFAWFELDENGQIPLDENGNQIVLSGDESITVSPEDQQNYRLDISFLGACDDEFITVSGVSTVTPLVEPTTIETCESTIGSGTADFDLNQTASIVNGLTISQYNIIYTNDAGDPITVLSPYTSTGETITVTVEDPTDATCFSTFTFDLVVMPFLDSTFNYAFSNYCLNDANPIPDSITTIGGVFTIDNGGFIDAVTGEVDLTLSGLGTDTTGSFNVIYATAEPCSTTTTVTITLEQFFNANFEFPDSVCIDDANPIATRIATAGGTFSVNNGASIDASGELDLSTIIAGTYDITYEIAGNCTPSVTQTIEVLAEDDSSFSYIDNIVCIDDARNPIPTAVVSGGVYTIDNGGVIDAVNGQVSLADSGAGDFVITYTTPEPCSTFSPYTLTIVDVLFDNFVSSLTECDTYTLPTLAKGNYFSEPNGGGALLNAGDDIIATQIIYVFNESNTVPNCTDQYTFTVTIINTPIANTPTTELDSCNNGDNTANFDIDASSIEEEIVGLQTGLIVTYHPTQDDAENETSEMSTTPFLIASGNVWARVEGENNCFAVVEVVLTVEQCFLIFPEVFSPNSATAENREFNIDGMREMFPNFDMFVYNRYGKKVYTGNASNPNNWNGNVDNSGDELPTGTYYYIVKLHDEQQITHRGWVYLQR